MSPCIEGGPSRVGVETGYVVPVRPPWREKDWSAVLCFARRLLIRTVDGNADRA